MCARQEEIDDLVQRLDESIGRPPFPNPCSAETLKVASELVGLLEKTKSDGKLQTVGNSDAISTTLPILCDALPAGSVNEAPCLELYRLLLTGVAITAKFSKHPLNNILTAAETHLERQDEVLFRLYYESGALTAEWLAKALGVKVNASAAQESTTAVKKKRQNDEKVKKGPGKTISLKKENETNKMIDSSASAKELPIDSLSISKGAVSPVLPASLVKEILRANLDERCRAIYGMCFRNTEAFLQIIEQDRSLASEILSVYGASLIPQLKPSALLPCLDGSTLGYFIDIVETQNTKNLSLLKDPVFIQIAEQKWSKAQTQQICDELKQYAVSRQDCVGCSIVANFVFRFVSVCGAFNFEERTICLSQIAVALGKALLCCVEEESHNFGLALAMSSDGYLKVPNSSKAFFALNMLSYTFQYCRSSIDSDKIADEIVHENPQCMEVPNDETALIFAELNRKVVHIFECNRDLKEGRYLNENQNSQNNQKSAPGKGKGSKGNKKKNLSSQPSSSSIVDKNEEDSIVRYNLGEFLEIVTRAFSFLLSKTRDCETAQKSLRCIGSVYQLNETSDKKMQFDVFLFQIILDFALLVLLLEKSQGNGDKTDYKECFLFTSGNEWHSVQQMLALATEVTNNVMWILPLMGHLPHNDQLHWNRTLFSSQLTAAITLCVGTSTTNTPVEWLVARLIKKERDGLLQRVIQFLCQTASTELLNWYAQSLIFEKQISTLSIFKNTVLPNVSEEDSSRTNIDNLANFLEQLIGDREEDAAAADATKREIEKKIVAQKLAEEERLAVQKREFEKRRAKKQKRWLQQKEVVEKMMALRAQQRAEIEQQERAQLIQKRAIALKALEEERTKNKETLRAEQQQRLANYAERMMSDFLVTQFMDGLNLPSTVIMDTKKELKGRGLLEKITPDELLEFLVTGNPVVPSDLRELVGLECDVQDVESQKKKEVISDTGDFWTDVFSGMSTKQVAQSHQKSFHYRVKPFLDLFCYAEGDETGNLPNVLPFLRLSIVEKIIPKSELEELNFSNVEQAFVAMQRRGLVTLRRGLVQLTVLGFRYHFPFHDDDCMLEIRIRQNAALVRELLKTRKEEANANDVDFTGSDNIEEYENYLIDKGRETEDRNGDNESGENEEGDSEEYLDNDEDDEDDEKVLPELEFGI